MILLMLLGGVHSFSYRSLAIKIPSVFVAITATIATGTTHLAQTITIILLCKFSWLFIVF